jgi:hypothetical protein
VTVMTPGAWAVLAETLAAGWLALWHDLRHHGTAARVRAALYRLPAPAPTAHRHWYAARPSPRQRRLPMAAGVLIDAGLAVAWLAGYQLLVAAVLAVSLAAMAAAWTTIPRFAQGGHHESRRGLLPGQPAPAPRRH